MQVDLLAPGDQLHDLPFQCPQLLTPDPHCLARISVAVDQEVGEHLVLDPRVVVPQHIVVPEYDGLIVVQPLRKIGIPSQQLPAVLAVLGLRVEEQDFQGSFVGQELVDILAHDLPAWFVDLLFPFLGGVEWVQQPLLEFGVEDMQIDGGHALNDRHDVLGLAGGVDDGEVLESVPADIISHFAELLREFLCAGMGTLRIAHSLPSWQYSFRQDSIMMSSLSVTQIMYILSEVMGNQLCLKISPIVPELRTGTWRATLARWTIATPNQINALILYFLSIILSIQHYFISLPIWFLLSPCLIPVACVGVGTTMESLAHGKFY